MSVNNLASSGQNYSGLSTGKLSSWQTARDERYQEYRRLWAERPPARGAGRCPLHLDIEASHLCNIRCVMCPRTKYLARNDWKWSPNGLGMMDFDVYKNLIDQGASGGVYSVKLNMLGEPLLHPGVTDQIAYAHDRGLYVMINTNAMLLDNKMSAELLEAGLDDVFFSLDAPDKTTFEQIRPGARFETVLENIRRFIDIKNRLGKRHVQTRASMVTDVLHPTSTAEQEAYRKLVSSLGVEEVGFGPEDDHLADHSAENMARGNKFVCDQIYQRTFITWDGAIVPCCGHWEREYLIGRIDEISIAEAWKNNAYQRIRQAHEAGRYQTISICRRCSVPVLDHQARQQGKETAV